MGEMKRVLRCVNCGEILQDTNPKEPGYYSLDNLDDVNPDHILYCDYCRSLLQINNEEIHENVAEDIITILEDAKESKALIVYTLDSFSFNGHIRHKIVDAIKELDVIVIANKIDLFEKDKIDSLKKYIQHIFNEYGIKPIDILMCSAIKNEIDQFSEIVAKHRKGRDIYLIGSVYSGKTTLVDAYMRVYKNSTDRPVTHITFKGTKTRVTCLPLDKTASLYALPGFVNSDFISGKSDLGIMKYIIPDGKIKPKIERLRVGESLLFGGLAIYSLINGDPTSFKLYFAKGVMHRRVITKEAFKTLRLNLITKRLMPLSDKFTSFKDFDVYDFVLENDNKAHDIAIEGFGWLSFIAKGQTIRVILPRGVSIKETLAKVK